MTTSLTGSDLVSIIIPCFNHAQFLGEAIDSVLEQTYPNIEIIVVDDGSTDDIQRVMTAYPTARYMRQENLGVSRARNAGLSASRGDYVLFLDSDDRLLPDAVEIGMHTLASRSDCAFAFGLYTRSGTIHRIKGMTESGPCSYIDLLRRNVIGNPGSVLYHRWIFSSVGGFDESNGPAADYDLYLRIAQRYPIVCHHRPVVEYRMHDSNMSGNSRVMLHATLAALKKQERHALRDPETSAAYDAGRQFFTRYYGEPLIDNMYNNVGQGNLRQVVLEAYTLIRFYPGRLFLFVWRKLSRCCMTIREKLSSRE